MKLLTLFIGIKEAFGISITTNFVNECHTVLFNCGSYAVDNSECTEDNPCGMMTNNVDDLPNIECGAVYKLTHKQTELSGYYKVVGTELSPDLPISPSKQDEDSLVVLDVYATAKICPKVCETDRCASADDTCTESVVGGCFCGCADFSDLNNFDNPLKKRTVDLKGKRSLDDLECEDECLADCLDCVSPPSQWLIDDWAVGNITEVTAEFIRVDEPDYTEIPNLTLPTGLTLPTFPTVPIPEEPDSSFFAGSLLLLISLLL
eukprot:GHVP01050728.1.p1 GENE.GHVP01050728.1~~GHVP01050728.1.p1  ORF type:complete len:262 (+),score=39.85 GHVP01050728.1:51-836(+)